MVTSLGTAYIPIVSNPPCPNVAVLIVLEKYETNKKETKCAMALEGHSFAQGSVTAA
jgi:hypothetical protein